MLAMGGCTAIQSLDAASRQLDTYELSSVSPVTSAAGVRGGPTLFVATPVSSGAIASDRIVVKPDPFQVTFLPDARWVDPAGVHLQLLLTRSLSGLTRYGLVTASSSAPFPDFTLMTDVEDFQVELASNDQEPTIRVVVRVQAALVQESNGRVVARRTFQAIVAAADTRASGIVPAFDAATASVQRELVTWLSTITPIAS
ncbi:MAG: ABC-type transport auxiliary lipoprotein family protein [Pseudomonadota bacterium]